ncbi:MAG TPA: serine/threonine-protein kinase [Gaiellaceae bacterium]|nr:serine/threonine-protein kinase [Gaiellaceae bacterium]
MSTLAQGTVVDGLRVRELLGAGAMGTVYLAEAVMSGDIVALKLIGAGPSQDTRFRERFERECALATSLRHPNVVRTISAGESEGQLYLAMEYVEGSDLREILNREAPLEPARAVRLIAQVADGLDAAHELGLVHRDVKPGNILVTERAGDEHALVCDFGLARHVSSVSSLTGDRGFVGTIDYVSPEQIEGRQVDRRSDLYSLGCVLFECLVGAKPFGRESELSVVFAQLNDPPPRPTEFRPELPAAWDEFFAMALAKDPDERYATCGELATAARAALRGEAVPLGRRRRRVVGLAALGVVAAAAAVVGALLATNTSPGPAALPKITPSAIDGVTLGRPRSYYARMLGPYRAFVETPVVPGAGRFPAISFEGPEVAAYFLPHARKALVITTWNRAFRTAAGIGPCSTLARMREVYGRRAVPTYSGTSPNGKVHFSYQLGRNLLFVTENHKTISSVVLFKGPANARSRQQPPGTYQGDANYLGANETKCE